MKQLQPINEHQLYRDRPEAWGAYMALKHSEGKTRRDRLWAALDDEVKQVIRDAYADE